MVKFYPSIPPDLHDWLLAQPVFFAASAPLSGKHINVSPKGHPRRTLSLLSPNQAAYLDATGSGAETIAHVYENGRVTLLFCGFGRAPRIVRLFCRGRVVERGGREFGAWVARMRGAGMEIAEDGGGEGEGGMRLDGIRAVIVLDVWKVQTSCGFGVPLLGGAGEDGEAQLHPATGIDIVTHDAELPSGAKGEVVSWIDRPTMPRWANKMVERDALGGYRKQANWRSLDGLPGLRMARRDRGQWMWVENIRAWGRRIGGQREAVIVGVALGLLGMLVLTRLGLLRVESGW